MSSHELPPGDPGYQTLNQVLAAIPMPWAAVIVLARTGRSGETEFLIGGKCVDREFSIRMLRRILTELEAADDDTVSEILAPRTRLN